MQFCVFDMSYKTFGVISEISTQEIMKCKKKNTILKRYSLLTIQNYFALSSDCLYNYIFN